MIKETLQKPRLGLPFAGGHWTELPRESQGDANEDAIYLAVGKTLSEWETLELIFSWFFGLFVGGNCKSPASSVAKRAYGMLASAKGRQDILMAASIPFFKMAHGQPFDVEEDRENFLCLFKHFEKGSKIRNNVALAPLLSGSLETEMLVSFWNLPTMLVTRSNIRKLRPSLGRIFRLLK